MLWVQAYQPKKVGLDLQVNKPLRKAVPNLFDTYLSLLISIASKLAALFKRHFLSLISRMPSRRSARISAMPQASTLTNSYSAVAKSNGVKVATKPAAVGRKTKALPKNDSQENNAAALQPSSKVKVAAGRKRKAVTEDGVKENGDSPPNISSTPKKSKTILPPTTPTPAAAGIMAVPYSSGDVGDEPPPAIKNRLADPFSTNAPLVSPASSRIISNRSAESASPSKLSSSEFKTTTSNLLDEACAHLLKVEPRLKPVIEAHRCHLFTPEGLAEEIDPFRSLASGIIGQQVSGAAAKAIKNRFIALFSPPDTVSPVWPSPAQVAEADITTLRTAGLSQRKAEYIKGLAEKFVSGELSTETLFAADYDKVFEKLIAVRGLGKWSVEMFACFGLKRMDVFSTGDLGVQ